MLTPTELLHQEIPFHVSHVTTTDGQQIPYGLHVLLESMKKQYVKMVQQMQNKEYQESIKDQISAEKERKELLTKRVKQLENQIDNLIQDSLVLLKARLRELGISADTPTEFIGKAKGIVCSHNDLQKKKGDLEAEIRKLELDQETIITKKEKEILDAVLAQRSGSNNDVNIAELRNMVKSEIKACLDGKTPQRSTSPLPKVGSDVTLTKVPGPNNGEHKSNVLVEVKKPESAVVLPKVEMNFGSVPDNKPRSESSESQAFGKVKATSAPRANDDYEDRFKKIITSELAKSGEKERGQPRVTLSPTKPGNNQDPESRSNFIPQRRPDIKTEPRGFDPRYPDPRALANGPRNIPVDSRFEGHRGPGGRMPPTDPRMINDGRLGHDPRIFDPRTQDSRSLDIRPANPRSQDPRYNSSMESVPLPRDGLVLPRDGSLSLSREGPPMSREGHAMSR